MRNQDKIVGFEIQSVHGLGVTTKIDKVGLQFNSPGQVTVYVFHSLKAEPGLSADLRLRPRQRHLQMVRAEGLVSALYERVGSRWDVVLVYVQRDLIPDDGVLMEAVVRQDWNASRASLQYGQHPGVARVAAIRQGEPRAGRHPRQLGQGATPSVGTYRTSYTPATTA